jgi:hypothetical protein
MCQPSEGVSGDETWKLSTARLEMDLIRAELLVLIHLWNRSRLGQRYSAIVVSVRSSRGRSSNWCVRLVN